MIESGLERSLINLRRAGRKLSSLKTETKNSVLLELADALVKSKHQILQANKLDLANLASEVTVAFRDRLTLNDTRIDQMAESLRAVSRLPDPVGEIEDSKTLPNGLKIRRTRSPLGTILMIFESRPNVITEVFSLALKSGNAIALRGGSESKESNRVLYSIIHAVLESHALDPFPFVGIEDYDRSLVGRLLQRPDLFDVCIPRGGDSLIQRVTSEAKMPLIKNDRGVCHLYIHEEADLDMALKLAINAKTQRPSVCNSIETVLIDQTVLEAALAKLIPELDSLGVTLFLCEDSFKAAKQLARTDGIESIWAARLKRATDENFRTEYMDLKLNVKSVPGYELAVFHIEHFGSNHSDCIVTRNESIARQFQSDIDSACVYWNASTRFTDGYELGLGGEIGVSTQKLHVRGPVGLRELTSFRWLIDGDGTIRS